MVEYVVGVRPRRLRLLSESHVGFFRRKPRLAVIARDTRADHILPIVRTVLRAWPDVVQGQFPGFLTAVLAGKPVSVEYGPSGQPAHHQRALHHVDQPYYRRDGEDA